MNNDQVNQIIQGLSLITELWTITYNGFKSQGLNDDDAIKHTKSFMAIIVEELVNGTKK